MLKKLGLQRKIAEVLGWTRLGQIDGVLCGSKPRGTIRHQFVPNWPTDRNASYELPVKLKGVFRKAYKTLEIEYSEILAEHPIDPAWFECHVWLLSEHGWRWVDCASCEGEPHGVSEDCTDCNGEGGEWESDQSGEFGFSPGRRIKHWG